MSIDLAIHAVGILISVHFAKMKQGRRVLMVHKDYIVIIRKLKSIEYILGLFYDSVNEYIIITHSLQSMVHDLKIF